MPCPQRARGAPGAPRAGRRCGRRWPRGSGRTSPAGRDRRWSPSGRRHRRPGWPGAGPAVRPTPKCRPDEDDRSPAERLGDDAPASRRPVASPEVIAPEPRAYGRPRGSSGRRGGRPADQPFERPRVGRRCADGRRTPAARRPGPPHTRRRLRRACAARVGVSRYHRSPASRRGGRADPPEAGRRATTPRSADPTTHPPPAVRRGSSWSPGALPRRRARVRAAGLHRSARRSRSRDSRPGRRPDRLEAVPLLGAPHRWSPPARRRCAWVARWRSAGSVEATSIGLRPADVDSVPSGWRRMVIGRIRDPVLAASVAGPAGSVVHAPNRRTGIPSAR